MPSTRAISWVSASQSTGLLAKPSMPASMLARRCSASTLAVIAMIGTRGLPAASACARIRRAAARPSSTGICTSIRIRSNLSLAASSTAARPSPASLHHVAAAFELQAQQLAVLRHVVGHQDPQRRQRRQRRGRARARELRLRQARQHQRQQHVEGGAGARLALGPDASVHQFDQLLADRGAQAGAAEAARHRGVGLRERFEDRLQAPGRDADAGVGHPQAQLALERVGMHGDAAPFGELDRIVEQVGEHLAHAQFVAAQAGRQVGVVLDVHVQALGARIGAQGRRELVDQRQQVVVVQFEFDRAFFQLGGIEDFVQEPQQRAAGAAHIAQVAALLVRQLAVQQDVGKAEDRVHRRADLVAHVGHEARRARPRRVPPFPWRRAARLPSGAAR